MMTMESKTPLWYSNFLFPWMGNFSRLILYADQFAFTNDTISRKKYQRRFAFAISIQLAALIKHTLFLYINVQV